MEKLAVNDECFNVFTNKAHIQDLKYSNKSKMKSFQKYILLGLLCVFTTSLFAGGWPQPKNKGYFKLSEWWLVANEHYTDLGRIDPNVTTGLFITSLYGEYGLTDKLTVIAYLPFFSRSYFNNTVSGTTGEVVIPGAAINSFGDTDLALKYGLLRKGPWALSGTLLFGLPLGNADSGVDGLQTGDGEFNSMLQVDLGVSFPVGGLNAYANAYVAYNNRSNGFSDEFRYGLEAGVSLLNNKLTAIGRVYGIEAMNNGDELGTPNSTSLFGNRSEHLTVAGELAYQVGDNWGLSVSAATAVRGQIILAGTAWSAGVFVKI